MKEAYTYFYIQDPAFSEGALLHETLLSECELAQEGAAAFAFASSEGIDLLLGDGVFSSFMSHGHFDLIVGLDSITDTKALERLCAYEECYGGSLRVRAFVNNTPRSTFHPKISWFDHSDKASVIVGSGNLTLGGLRGHKEAYAAIPPPVY